MNNLSMLQLFFMATGVIALAITATFVVYLKLLGKKHTVLPNVAIRKNQKAIDPVLHRNLTSVLQ